MTISMRLTAVVLALLVSTLGMASLAFAQEADDCYPVPVDGCEVPTETGVLPDDGSSEDPKDPEAPSVTVEVAGQAPVVLAQTELAQTGMAAATLLAVAGLTLASGLVLLLTTRRRSS